MTLKDLKEIRAYQAEQERLRRIHVCEVRAFGVLITPASCPACRRGEPRPEEQR